MQVILLENIKKLGTIGEKVTVSDGYARNFLLKNKKALLANKKNIELFEKQKTEINKKNEIEKEKAKEISKIIHDTELDIQKEAMENGQLYGCRRSSRSSGGRRRRWAGSTSRRPSPSEHRIRWRGGG